MSSKTAKARPSQRPNLISVAGARRLKIPTVRQPLAPPAPITAPAHGTNIYRK